MPTVPQLDADTLRLVAVALVSVLVWELLKRLYKRLSKTTPPVLEVPPEFKDFPVPLDPHFEMAVHPPQGLHHSNPKSAYTYDCIHCTGSYLCFHSPTGQNTTHGPGGFNYGEYFVGKSRLWEMRFHLNFKTVPRHDEELFFGIELDQFVSMSRATKEAQKIVVKGVKQAVGGVYHSAGDTPGSTRGEEELPSCVLPLWAFDQFIVTPEGEEPPDLWDKDFSSFGSRRYQRVKEYAQEISEMQKNIKVGPTYTFAFWGNSRFLDVINWTVIGIPLVTPVSFDKFAGKAPVHVVLYSLPKDTTDRRHLRSKKTYYFRCAIWSSLFRPERNRIEALTGQITTGSQEEMEQSPTSGEMKPKTLRRRIAGFFKHGFADCYGRPK